MAVIAPEMTKAVSWNRKGVNPTACMRSGFSRAPVSTRPKRDPVIATQRR